MPRSTNRDGRAGTLTKRRWEPKASSVVRTVISSHGVEHDVVAGRRLHQVGDGGADVARERHRQGRVAALDQGEDGQAGQPGEPPGDLVVLAQHRRRPVDDDLRRAGDQPVEQGRLGRRLGLGVGAGGLDLPGLVEPEPAALDGRAAHVDHAGDPAVVGGLGQHLGEEHVGPPQAQEAAGAGLGQAGGVDHHRAAGHGVEQPAPLGRVLLAPRRHRVGPGLDRRRVDAEAGERDHPQPLRRRFRRHCLTDEARRPAQQNTRFQAAILPQRDWLKRPAAPVSGDDRRDRAPRRRRRRRARVATGLRPGRALGRRRRRARLEQGVEGPGDRGGPAGGVGVPAGRGRPSRGSPASARPSTSRARICLLLRQHGEHGAHLLAQVSRRTPGRSLDALARDGPGSRDRAGG